MGTLFRSEEMQLVQLFVQIEAAHDTVDELGKLGVIQFRDLNSEVSAFQRNFVNEVKRTDEMERKLRFFEEQVRKERKEIISEGKTDRDALTLLTVLGTNDRKMGSVDELETQFEDIEKELNQMNNNQEVLNRNYNELIEMKHVLTKDSAFFSEATVDLSDADSDAKAPLVDPNTIEVSKAVKLGFITGVIKRDKFPSFERVLWRSTRGNLFMKHSEIEEKIKDPHTGELVEKSVFIIFYQGERSHQKIKKICESFGANSYQIPDSGNDRKSFLQQVNNRLEDLVNVISRTKKHRRQVLMDVGQSLPQWKEKVVKEKAIYDTMNMFNYDVGRKCLIAEGWCPKTSTEQIMNAMRAATETSGALVPSILSVIKAHEEPPTYFRNNKFTVGFQNLVEAYGIAHYREVNPGVFTIITFPFLFAVMFGDFGHGILMVLFATYLVVNEKKLANQKLNEMISMCFGGRYIILLMGIFSIYTGLLYNEAFAVAMNIFGTKYTLPAGNETEFHWTGAVYPFGVDPAWNGASNMLTYYNSLKMKMSIIFGVTHMTGGIFLSLLNALHFHHGIDIIGEFIPQVIFLLSLFGYMCFLIIFKWCVNWSGQSPPLILNVMINMFLSFGSLSEDMKMFSGQGPVQTFLVIIAVIAIPWMLLTKPLYLRYKNKQRMIHKPVHAEDDDESDEHGSEAFDFGELMVKQTIHTIEYVLGAISSTASYLRLWALSLAHSQLSAVFWERLFMLVLTMAGNSVPVGMFAVFIGFAIWAGLTGGVLMVMESLSAFLHALRLHWVEFQNKFYHGDGRKFTPFSYDRILNPEDD
eukprot:TRINITY_DN817_c0_g1_i1.p1 TRINITY_DN817_c0_g1~~TRINITY_DN817_c0_g1_i1.p1  ORF type:complete len:810 (-),score=258.95 TRINITY_DN817_c0_g1_i1:55-2484(-)